MNLLRFDQIKVIQIYNIPYNPYLILICKNCKTDNHFKDSFIFWISLLTLCKVELTFYSFSSVLLGKDFDCLTIEPFSGFLSVNNSSYLNDLLLSILRSFLHIFPT